MTRTPGHKPREYPHSSGDRNTFPLERHPDKGVSGGGRQRVAPNEDAGATPNTPAPDTPAPRER